MNAFFSTLFNRREWMNRADKLHNIRSFDGIQLNPTGHTFNIKDKQKQLIANERLVSLYLKVKTNNEFSVLCYIKRSEAKDAFHVLEINSNELGGYADGIKDALNSTAMNSLTQEQENVILKIIFNQRQLLGPLGPCKYKNMQGLTLLRHISKDYGHYRFLRPYQSIKDVINSELEVIIYIFFEIMAVLFVAAGTAFLLLLAATYAVCGFVTDDYSEAKLFWDGSLNTLAMGLMAVLDIVDNLLIGLIAPISRTCATLVSALVINETPVSSEMSIDLLV